MLALLAGVALISVQAPCPPDAVALMDQARLYAADFDLRRAADQLRSAGARGCREAEVGALYLGGLVDARESFRQGGSPEALAPVQQAIAALGMIAQGRPGPAEITRLMLQAAAAAAQSERGELRLYVEAAVQMELIQRVAGQSVAPFVPAVEIAGDLWLLVHQYEDARRAYTYAVEHVGFTARILSGLARAADRLGDTPEACEFFRKLVDHWGARATEPDEILEARAYVGQPVCRSR